MANCFSKRTCASLSLILLMQHIQGGVAWFVDRLGIEPKSAKSLIKPRSRAYPVYLPASFADSATTYLQLILIKLLGALSFDLSPCDDASRLLGLLALRRFFWLFRPLEHQRCRSQLNGLVLIGSKLPSAISFTSVFHVEADAARNLTIRR